MSSPADGGLVVCPRCGRHRRLTDQACPHCGHVVDQPVSSAPGSIPSITLYGLPPYRLRENGSRTDGPEVRDDGWVAVLYGPPPASALRGLKLRRLRRNAALAAVAVAALVVLWVLLA